MENVQPNPDIHDKALVEKAIIIVRFQWDSLYSVSGLNLEAKY